MHVIGLYMPGVVLFIAAYGVRLKLNQLYSLNEVIDPFLSSKISKCENLALVLWGSGVSLLLAASAWHLYHWVVR